MDLKTSLSQLFDQIDQAELDYIDSLTPAERQASGQIDAWAPKETLAHMAVWQDRLAQNIDAAFHGGELQHYENYLELNDRDFEANRLKSWDNCLDNAGQCRSALRQLFDSLDEAGLQRLDILPWQEGRPIWKLFVGNIVDHPVSHLCMLYNARGDHEKALCLQEQTSRALAGLDPDPRWQGNVRYNLACVYALSGQKEKAILELNEAFKLNPGLMEWSKQDTDLDSLRQEPSFLALYAAQE
jgi:tetratricopeptide (TPR) repeat protein